MIYLMYGRLMNGENGHGTDSNMMISAIEKQMIILLNCFSFGIDVLDGSTATNITAAAMVINTL